MKVTLPKTENDNGFIRRIWEGELKGERNQEFTKCEKDYISHSKMI